MTNSSLNQPAKIMAVDDHTENLGMIYKLLKHNGYNVTINEDAATALRWALDNPPDLILLDVMMPNMNGFEACRRFKQEPSLQDIPIIFMTALTDMQSKEEGFTAGAVDYITKPFEGEEILLRVNTHLTLRRQRIELEHQKQKLEELNLDKSEFFSIAAHDLKNPLNSLNLVIDALLNNLLPPEQHQEYFQLAHTCVARMTTLINQLLNIDRIESNRIVPQQQPINVLKLLQDMQFNYQQAAQAKQLNLQLESSQAGQEYIALADETLCLDILDNLISNAIKYSPRQTTITLRLGIENEQSLRCEVQDQGPGFTAADKTRMFAKFSRLSARPTGGESSSGLGLFIVKKFVELMQGQIWCESEAGQGAKFVLILPRADGTG